MAHLVGEHAGELTQVERAQQAVGDADHRVVALTDGEGVHHRTRHIVESGLLLQAGTPGEMVDNPKDFGQL